MYRTVGTPHHSGGGVFYLEVCCMKKSIIAAMFIAIGVALSTFHVTIGGAKIFPVQHMINVILAVLVGAR